MIILQVKSVHKDLYYDYYAIRLSCYNTTTLYNVGFGIQTLRRFFLILFVVQWTFYFISNLFHILLLISIVRRVIMFENLIQNLVLSFNGFF